MSLRLPKEPTVGRIRRYSDRVLSGCKDLASECTVSIIGFSSMSRSQHVTRRRGRCLLCIPKDPRSNLRYLPVVGSSDQFQVYDLISRGPVRLYLATYNSRYYQCHYWNTISSLDPQSVRNFGSIPVPSSWSYALPTFSFSNYCNAISSSAVTWCMEHIWASVIDKTRSPKLGPKICSKSYPNIALQSPSPSQVKAQLGVRKRSVPCQHIGQTRVSCFALLPSLNGPKWWSQSPW